MIKCSVHHVHRLTCNILCFPYPLGHSFYYSKLENLSIMKRKWLQSFDVVIQKWSKKELQIKFRHLILPEFIRISAFYEPFKLKFIAETFSSNFNSIVWIARFEKINSEKRDWLGSMKASWWKWEYLLSSISKIAKKNGSNGMEIFAECLHKKGQGSPKMDSPPWKVKIPATNSYLLLS